MQKLFKHRQTDTPPPASWSGCAIGIAVAVIGFLYLSVAAALGWFPFR